MNVGTGSKNADGQLEFIVQFPLMQEFRLFLIGNPKAGPENNLPAFHCHIGRHQAGAVWKKTSSKSGIDYLQGHLESPVFSGGKARITIFKATEDERRGQMDVLWEPPKDAPAAAKPAPAAGNSGGMDMAEDDIPF